MAQPEVHLVLTVAAAVPTAALAIRTDRQAVFRGEQPSERLGSPPQMVLAAARTAQQAVDLTDQPARRTALMVPQVPALTAQRDQQAQRVREAVALLKLSE